MMAETYKILGQEALAETTLTAIYTVPASTAAIVSTVVMCNRSASPVAARLSVAKGGEADNLKQYLYYDTPVPANDSIVLTIGITLQATDVIRAHVASAEISVSVFGLEIT